jgi:hypothetical protein
MERQQATKSRKLLLEALKGGRKCVIFVFVTFLHSLITDEGEGKRLTFTSR